MRTPGYLDLPALGRYGRFELLGRLAYGGMAEIFLAREQLDGGGRRHLVIKRVLPHVADDERFLGMFRDEARLAMYLNHPSICHIYEFGREEGTYFIAMEWVNGVSLKKLIRRARGDYGVPIPVAAKIIADVAGALHYAHRACDEQGRRLGIVHRDVSPPNIMINFDGAVKLLDFGVAKARSHLTKTQTGAIKGKFAYMAPEQCVGQVIDYRVDVFALGVCLYEALAGKWLYARSTEFETMRAIVMEESAPSVRSVRPEVPEALDDIVRRALARDPDARFQSAGEMRDAIERALVAQGEHVNEAHVASYMKRMFDEEYRRGPLVDSSALAHSFGVGSQIQARPAAAQRGDPTLPESSEQSLVVHEADVDVEQFARARRRKTWLLGAVFALVLGGAAFALVQAVLGDGSSAAADDASDPAADEAPADEPPAGRRAPRFDPPRPSGK